MAFDRSFVLLLVVYVARWLHLAWPLFVIMLLMQSCGGGRAPEQEPDRTAIREALAESNKLLIAAEDQEIRDFVSRHGWQVEESGTGLRYMWVDRGAGRQAQKGLWASIAYRIYLLTGDQVYASPDDEPKRFRIGQGGVESGLEEGILMMREGDKARLIMPPHLAHGVPGDGVKIPKRASIVYEIELLKLSEY